MVDYILGNYLVECGKISKAQLHEILRQQDCVRAKLGLIAVAEDMMTYEQAEEVNRLQAVMDKRFGDIAVEKGYLTEGQVAQLLKQQGSVWLSFMQALLDAALVTLEEMEWLLYDFKRAYGYNDAQLEALKSDEVEQIVPLLLPKEAQKYKDIICVAVRTMIRLIDRHVYLAQAAMVEELPLEDMVTQELEGENGFIDCLAERDGALLRTCAIFGQEEFPRLNMDALDAAGELLNCMNGLYVSARSREGTFLELMPPGYCMNIGQVNSGRRLKDICRIPIFIGNKGLYFVVGEP